MVLEKENTKAKRCRSAVTHRWNDKQTLALVTAVYDEVINSNFGFELPNCQKFYTKIIEKRCELNGLEWRVLKSKIRNLRTTYNTAMTWKKQNEPKLLAAGDKKVVTEYINRICPHWVILEQIYGRQSKNKLKTDSLETLSSDHDEFPSKMLDYITEKDTDEMDKKSITNSLMLSKAGSSVALDDISVIDTVSKDDIMDGSFEINLQNDVEPEDLEEQKGTKTSKNVQMKFVKSTSSQEKPPPKVNFSLDSTNSVSLMVSMQNERLLKEERMHLEKLEFEEKKWREMLKLEREKLEVKRQEIESNEKVALAKLDLEKDAKRSHFKIEEKKLQMETEEKKLRIEMEERLQKYEMKLKYERH